MSKDPALREDVDPKELAEEMILGNIPAQKREYARGEIYELLSNWEGRETDVLCVLHYASIQGKLIEYIGKLAETWKKYLQFVPKKSHYRSNAAIPHVSSAIIDVSDLYKELGVKPQR